MEENEKLINAADGYREAFQLLTHTEIKIKFGEASEAEKKQHDSQVRGRNNSEAKLKQEAGSDQVFEELKAKAEAEAASNLIETFKKTLEAKLNELKSATEKSANAKDAMSNVVAYNRKKDVARVKAELKDLLAMLPESEREEVRKEIEELEKGIMGEPEKQANDEKENGEVGTNEQEQAPETEPEAVPGTEQAPETEPEAETPEKKDGKVEIPPEIYNPLKDKVMGAVYNYISVVKDPAEKAIREYKEKLLGQVISTKSADADIEETLNQNAKNMGNREFLSKLAKDSLKEIFAAILVEAERQLSPEQVEKLKVQLKNEITSAVTEAFKGDISKPLGEHTNGVDNRTSSPTLLAEKNSLLEQKAKYESGELSDGEALKRIEKAIAILEGIEASRKELSDAKFGLGREIFLMDRRRESFTPIKKNEEEAKGEKKEKVETPEEALVTRFNEVKSTLFNPAVADKIDPTTFKYATGKDNKPILIVHVEFDGTRTADGKVNKQRATVVITENSVRKISEYVATMDPETYYKSLPESQGLPTSFKENMDKFLGPQGVDMRPIDKDGKKIEDPEKVPMLSESLVTTKTGMQQLVVNTPKGISAIAVGAKTKSLSYEQKQKIELFTEQQKEIALGTRNGLLDNHKTGLGNKIQDAPDAPSDASVNMVEAESNMKYFFKIFQTDQDSLAVGGTGNFKRDSKGEKIVKQNFMTFVFDKHDKANAEIEDGKDPKPLQFSITEREYKDDGTFDDKMTIYILGSDGKYYDLTTIKNAEKMADLESKGVEAAVILNRAGTLGIGDKFVSNVMKRDTAKALAEKAEDERIQADQLGYLKVDTHRKDRHVNSLELSIHNQATFEAKQPDKPKTIDEQEVGHDEK